MKHVATLTILTALMMPIDAAAVSPASEAADSPTASAITNPVVTVDASVPNASTVHRRVEASAREALARLKAPLDAGERVLVHVTGEQYEYDIRISAVRSNATLEESTVGCECNTAELSERVSVEVTRVAARFSQPTEEATTTVPVEPPHVEPTPQLEPPPPKAPAHRPRTPVVGPTKRPPATVLEPTRTREPVNMAREPRRLRVAGVVTLIAGSTLLFTGAGMMAAGSTELLDRWRHYQRDWRPLGFTLGGVGVAGIGVGGSLVLFDELRCRRRPRSCTSGRHYANRIDLE